MFFVLLQAVMKRILFAQFLLSVLLICNGCSGCGSHDDADDVIHTPFGDVVMADADTLPTTTSQDANYDLPDMEKTGELIVLTLEGKNTFYEFRRRALGAEYMLAERFARSLGMFIRCEACRDTLDMVRRLRDGSGDLIAYPLPRHFITSDSIDLAPAGAALDSGEWACRKQSPQLKEALASWYKKGLRAEVARDERMMIMTGGVTRHIYSPIYDRRGGKISVYDPLFRRYSSRCGWDWRLLAAQCYQESMFDADAQSFAGARGLMQLMPRTAEHFGLPRKDIFNPEKNVATACEYLNALMYKYRHVTPAHNRIKWVLAAYNCGSLHLEDAQALARQDGMNAVWNWERIAPYILKLESSEHYTNPIVRHGYMRGHETVNYVNNIMYRWNQYCGVVGPNR